MEYTHRSIVHCKDQVNKSQVALVSLHCRELQVFHEVLNYNKV